MPKQGIKFDYDMMANAEPSAQKEIKCIICEEVPFYRWTDYSGQAVCHKCGMAYQLKWGTDEQKKEGNYPYPGLKDIFIPIFKEYWNETKKFTFLGTSFREDEGMKEFTEWVRKKHPELLEKE